MAGLTVRELAGAVGGTVHGPDDIIITGAASIDDAALGDIILAEDSRYLALAEASAASAVVALDGVCGTKAVIRVNEPRQAFSKILEKLAREPRMPEPGVDPAAKVGERFKLGDGAAVGFGCWIGDDVTIGEGCVIYPLVYLGDGVRLGANSVLHPHVIIYADNEIGERVTIHAGTVIGSDGFGYIKAESELYKVPQIGRVVIEDNVEIGANVTIDRAKTGVTRIGRGTKIDNLVQIAHNVKIGEHCIIVAQTGLSGSAEVEDGVTIAGQVGVNTQVRIGSGAVVAAQSGVFGDLKAGGTYSGYPARPHKESLRAQAALLRLPELQKTVADLVKEVEQLKKQLK